MNQITQPPESKSTKTGNYRLLKRVKNYILSNKKVVLTVTIIIIFLMIGLILIAKNNQKSSDEIFKSQGESEEEEHNVPPLTEEEEFLIGATNTADIKVTKSGFMPQIITVKTDTKVVWTTDDNTTYSLAPNAGSKMTKYFDGMKEINLHKLYAARFNEEGTYTYHNPSSPTQNGTIIVIK